MEADPLAGSAALRGGGPSANGVANDASDSSEVKGLVEEYLREEEALLRRGAIKRQSLLPPLLRAGLVVMILWTAGFVIAAVLLKLNGYSTVR